jgi:N6-adenosine-specific RNA methylase IME4
MPQVYEDIKIDAEFSALIPPLSTEERHQLEENITEHGGARDPLVVWASKGTLTLLDGHNRYEICTRLGLPFDVHEMRLGSRDEASDWMDRNQLGRRNLHPDAFTLLLGRRYNRAKKAAHRPDKSVNVTELSGVTAERLAKEHGVTEKTVRNAGKFAEAVAKAEQISPGIGLKVAHGQAPARAAVIKAAALLEKSPDRARQIIDGGKKMADVIREEKRAEVVAKLENVEARKAKTLAGHYDVIVIDPPWPMEKIERDVTPEQVAFEYPTMREDELAAMQLPTADDCHVWVWTTHKFLPMCLRLLDAWGLKYVCTFVWHKPGGFQPFGLPQYNCEFAIYARRGTPQFIDTKAFPVCFDAPRGKHSEKPEAFYDVVRRVTAGRRIDIFNRRQIDGFDVWGKEADE